MKVLIGNNKNRINMKISYLILFIILTLSNSLWAAPSFFICRGPMAQYPKSDKLIGNFGDVTLNLELDVDQGFLKLDDMTCKFNEISNTYYARRKKISPNFIDEACSFNRLSLQLSMKVTEKRLMIRKNNQKYLAEGEVTVIYQYLNCTPAQQRI